MSGMSAYLATVFLPAPSSRAIRDLGTPSRSILLISSCSSRDTVISPSFPGRHSPKSAPRENTGLAVSLTHRDTVRI
jgi:hypothetical protein